MKQTGAKGGGESDHNLPYKHRKEKAHEREREAVGWARPAESDVVDARSYPEDEEYTESPKLETLYKRALLDDENHSKDEHEDPGAELRGA